jgi:hypothetical protein
MPSMPASISSSRDPEESGLSQERETGISIAEEGFSEMTFAIESQLLQVMGGAFSLAVASATLVINNASPPPSWRALSLDDGTTDSLVIHYHFYSWYCLDSGERDPNKTPSYYCTIPLHQCNKLFC